MIFFLTKKNTLYLSGILTFVLTLLLLYIDHITTGGQSPGIMALEFSFTKTRAMDIINLWGHSGQLFFIKTIWIDYVYSLCYGTLLASIITHLIFHGGRLLTHANTFPLVITLPFIASFFDMVENAYQVVLVMDGTNLPTWLFMMTMVVTMIKWICLTLSILVIFMYRRI